MKRHIERVLVLPEMKAREDRNRESVDSSIGREKTSDAASKKRKTAENETVWIINTNATQSKAGKTSVSSGTVK